MYEKVGIIGILVKRDTAIVLSLQELLSSYSEIIIGRMGVPSHDNNISAISVIVRGTNDQISSLAGKLGKLANVNVKSMVIAVDVD